MRAINIGLLKTKLKLALRAAWSVLIRPRYALLALLLAFIFFEIVYWAFNLSAFSVVMGSGLAVAEKIVFLVSPVKDIFYTSGVVVGVLMILVAVIQGINLALLAYTIKHQKKLNAGAIGGGSIAGLLAVVGLGCSACGTTLLAPIVAIVASTSAVAIAESLTVLAPLLAVLVGLIGLYYLGLQVANVNAKLHSGE